MMEIKTCYEYEPGGYFGDLLWYWTRGHVDKGQFVAEVAEEYDEEYSTDDVQHLYVRNVPAGPDEPGVTTMHIATQGRGAYPVTLIDVDLVAIRRAERLADLPLVADLARLSNDMADIDRLARDARQGKYVGTASKQDDD